MMLPRLLLLTAVLTLALITLGGVVHNTESSLACPDWPLCFGEILPEMKGGVAIEHSHRLLATLVGLCTIGILVLVERDRERWADIVLWARLALALVVGQGLLGGITVIWKLPTLVSTAHLATSMLFYCSLILMTVRAWPGAKTMACNRDPAANGALRWVLLAGSAVYLQMILGALVRHTGSGAAVGLGPDSVWVGFDLAAGQKDFWPADGPGRLHMAHRIFAVGVLGIVLAGAHKAFYHARRDGDGLAQQLAVGAVLLTLGQMALGGASIVRFLSIPLVTAHLTVAALLLTDLLLLRMRLARVPASLASLRAAPRPLGPEAESS